MITVASDLALTFTFGFALDFTGFSAGASANLILSQSVGFNVTWLPITVAAVEKCCQFTLFDKISRSILSKVT